MVKSQINYVSHMNWASNLASITNILCCFSIGFFVQYVIVLVVSWHPSPSLSPMPAVAIQSPLTVAQTSNLPLPETLWHTMRTCFTSP